MKKFMTMVALTLSVMLVTACGGWESDLISRTNDLASAYEEQTKILEAGKPEDPEVAAWIEQLDKECLEIMDANGDEALAAMMDEESDVSEAMSKMKAARSKWKELKFNDKSE